MFKISDRHSVADSSTILAGPGSNPRPPPSTLFHSFRLCRLSSFHQFIRRSDFSQPIFLLTFVFSLRSSKIRTDDPTTLCHFSTPTDLISIVYFSASIVGRNFVTATLQRNVHFDLGAQLRARRYFATLFRFCRAIQPLGVPASNLALRWTPRSGDKIAPFCINEL